MRWLSGLGRPASSVDLLRAVLASDVADEITAARVLRTAFGGDDRLKYEEGLWRVAGRRDQDAPVPSGQAGASDEDRVLLILDGGRKERRGRFVLTAIAAIRIRGDRVVTACAGETAPPSAAADLREAIAATIEGAVPVVHDAPGSLAAFESWLGEPLDDPVSTRRLGRLRFGLPADHSLEILAARMGLPFRESDDVADRARSLETCLEAMLGSGQTLSDLRATCREGTPAVPWQRYAFDRAFLRGLPAAPGTYRFLDASGNLLYVGKSDDLRRRIGSYFSEASRRTPRVARLIDALHRIEVVPSGSGLEAVLREAAEIARRRPAGNVQRRIRPVAGRGERLTSILILEPAEPPWSLRAYLIREGLWIERVTIGPRGGGLRRIERVLDDRFFSAGTGPVSRRPVPVDVEIVARWLAANRDRAVAFDPTHLKSAREVVERLRWFLGHGTLLDPGGAPILPR